MTACTHDTAPTQFVEAGGIQFTRRRFGNPERTPLVFFQHLMGNLDDHVPALSDGFATDREVILFNSTGATSTSGPVQFRPNAQLLIHPDANHGDRFRYRDLFVKHVRLFLDER